MSFKIPTLSEVNRNVENGFSKAFYGSSGILRVMVLKVISKVVAGSMYLVVLLLSYIWKNSFVASAEVDGLVRIGSKRNFPPKPATVRVVLLMSKVMLALLFRRERLLLTSRVAMNMNSLLNA
jgi:uncharacterized phage protein gp47/JayE